MEISLEIPINLIDDFLPLTDFAFGLAQLYLRDDYEHAQQYRKAYQGCLLDNGMYELGEPLSNTSLLVAADRAMPIALIAPDWMGDKEKTLRAVDDLFSREGWVFTSRSIGGVVQGVDLYDRIECFHQLQDKGCKPICFPFRTPRNETIGHLMAEGAFRDDGWYHLLGLQSPLEMRWRFPGRWSMDTSKPFKGPRLDRVDNIRGHGRLDLHERISRGSMKYAAALYNVALLRRWEHQ